MDGNGRWAELHGVSVAEGHRAGTRALRRTVEAAIELGIGTLVVYAFSTENWARPADEVADLLVLLSETIDGELPDLAKQGVRTRFLGRRDRIDDAIRMKMRELEDETAHLDTLDLWIAFDYGGRAELVEAARRLVADGVDREATSTSRRSRSGCTRPSSPTSTCSCAPRASSASRTSCSGRPRTPSSSSRRRSGPTSARSELRAAVEAYTARRAPLRGAGRRVSPFWSRIVVTAVLLPVVLGLVWVGRLVALRARARRWAAGASRALRDVARPAPDRPRRLRRARAHAARRATRRPGVAAARDPRDAACGAPLVLRLERTGRTRSQGSRSRCSASRGWGAGSRCSSCSAISRSTAGCSSSRRC